MNPVDVFRGDGPVILGQPHGGTFIPDGIFARLNGIGRLLADTDWHIGRLYEGLLPNATTVCANFHRYVIDANRDPSGDSLYPGQNTTSLCPLTDFDGQAIWHVGEEPKAADIETRKADWHSPYHTALSAEIERVKSKHGLAVVFDCHSIRSQIPYLFNGILPTINIGTDNGKTCARSIEELSVQRADASSFAAVLNGRFRGGWTTRIYGQPAMGVHAIQMEIAQNAYLDREAAPWTYDETKASELRIVLKDILQLIADEALRLSKGKRS